MLAYLKAAPTHQHIHKWIPIPHIWNGMEHMQGNENQSRVLLVDQLPPLILH